MADRGQVVNTEKLWGQKRAPGTSRAIIGTSVGRGPLVWVRCHSGLDDEWARMKGQPRPTSSGGRPAFGPTGSRHVRPSAWNVDGRRRSGVEFRAHQDKEVCGVSYMVQIIVLLIIPDFLSKHMLYNI